MVEGGAERPQGDSLPVPTVVDERRSSGGKSYLKRDLTTGSIPKNLWFLAWPQIIEGVLNVADQVADIVWAGRIGSRSIAGLGVAQSYAQLAMTSRMGFDVAMRAMIARAIGAGDTALASHTALQSFTLSGFFCVLMVVVGVFLTEPAMRLLRVSPEVIEAGAGYMRILFIAQGGVAIRMMAGAALQASGDAVTPMKATTVVRIVHIALSPCLVFGLLYFPEMGLAGAAVGNAFAQLIGVAMNFHALFTGKSRLHLSLKGFRMDFPLQWRIIKIGVPASVAAMERTLAQIMLVGLVAPFGDQALAAYALASRAEMLVSFGGMGLAQASGILAGQSLGAGKPNRARATVGWAMAFAAAIHLVVAAVLFIFTEAIVSIINDQPEFLGTAVIWLRIQAVGYVFMAGSVVFSQTFNNVGATMVPMVVTLISLWGVQQPAALVLPKLFGLGQYGIGWAINLATIVRVIVYLIYFIKGSWMKKNPFMSSKPKVSVP